MIRLKYFTAFYILSLVMSTFAFAMENDNNNNRNTEKRRIGKSPSTDHFVPVMNPDGSEWVRSPTTNRPVKLYRSTRYIQMMDEQSPPPTPSRSPSPPARNENRRPPTVEPLNRIQMHAAPRWRTWNEVEEFNGQLEPDVEVENVPSHNLRGPHFHFPVYLPPTAPGWEEIPAVIPPPAPPPVAVVPPVVRSTVINNYIYQYLTKKDRKYLRKMAKKQRKAERKRWKKLWRFGLRKKRH